MAKEGTTQCGAGQYWKRENKKGSVWAYAARKTWIPKEYRSGTCATKAEVTQLLKDLEKNYKNREFSTAASYFTPTETEAAYRKFLKFEDEFPDFKADRPHLDQIVEAGLRQWRFDPHYRLILQGAEYRVSHAYKIFFQERGNVILETRREEAKLLKLILSDWWDKSIHSLFEPFQLGDDPSRSVKNQLKVKIDKMRTLKGREYSKTYKKKSAQRISHFFKVIRNYYHISDPSPADDLVSEFAFKKKETPKTVNFERLINLFKLLKNEPRFQPLIPYAAMYWFTGRRPSDFYKYREGFGNALLDYSFFAGFADRSVLADGKGCKLYLPAERVNEAGVVITGTKGTKEEDGELSESGLLWIRYYFEELLGQELPKEGELFYSRDLWTAVRKAAGWDCSKEGMVAKKPNAWVQDVGRHTYNTAARLYYPEFTAYIASFAGHDEKTFKDHYKNPRLKVEDARIYFEDIRPDLI